MLVQSILSTWSRRYSVTFTIACTHDIFGRNPNWADVRILCFVQKDIIRVGTLGKL